MRGFLFLLLAWSTLGTIGPFLSYFSLQKAGFSEERALTYSVVTFLADLLNVLLLALVIKAQGMKYSEAVEKATLIYIPIWLSDVFDAEQKLRVFSNLGLIVSFFVIYKFFREEFLKISVYHLILYVLNAAVSEWIATNPLLKTIIEDAATQVR